MDSLDAIKAIHIGDVVGPRYRGLPVGVGRYEPVGEYEVALDVLLEQIRCMLLKKHHDYGTTNLLKHDLVGILVRCDDKLARASNLLKASPEVHETSEDTWADLAGYAIQAILMIRKIIR